MTAVGIKGLKSKLSEYVGRLASPERAALLEAVAEGKVSWSGGKPKGLRGVMVRGEPVSETVIRDRREDSRCG
jgi:hypothetical protein